MSRTPKIDMDSADKFSFALNEFKLSQLSMVANVSTIAQFQKTMAEDNIQIKNDIKSIRSVLFEKRDGKESICGAIDAHEVKIKSLEDRNKEKQIKRWQIIMVVITASIVQIIGILFILIKYIPNLINR
jgi:hypothetical protein